MHIAGEALWEPPKTGYTKHTGALVLSSGEVVKDPLEGNIQMNPAVVPRGTLC